MQDYLTRARVGVCPLEPDASIISERFTSPLKLLEMMAHGVPVVASDVPVDAGDRDPRRVGVAGSAQAIPRPWPAASGPCSTTGALAQRLAAAARQRVMAFSWQERARRLLDFLERAGRPSSIERARRRRECMAETASLTREQAFGRRRLAPRLEPALPLLLHQAPDLAKEPGALLS